MVLPDAAGLAAIALGLWFIVGAAGSEDPIPSLGRALPFVFMIAGAFCVVGPSLASPRGTVLLFRSAFVVSLLLSSSAVLGAFLGERPMWGLWGDRFYGPLNATTLGPICVTGLLAALAVWKVTTTRLSRLLVGVTALWLLLILVVTRARGSYVFMLVAATVYFALVSRRTLGIRLCCVAFVGTLALATASNWWSLDVSQSRTAAFLRLDQRDMLAQRSELWGANGSFWLESPLFGVGLGNEATMSEAAKRSHSAYLSTLNEGGLPALALLLVSVIAVTLRGWRTAFHHPRPELRLLGVLTVAIVVGTTALGIVETTLINAASTSNTLVWMMAGAAAAASREVPRRATMRERGTRAFRVPAHAG
jgi:O-antigen ligase